MDLNYVLKWICGVWALMGLARTARSRSSAARGWIWRFALLLAMLVVGEFLFPDLNGYVTGILFLIAIVLPMKLSEMINRRVLQQQYASAYRMTRYFGWLLRPFARWRLDLQQIRALELAHQGDFAGAQSILSAFAGSATPLSRMAHVQLYRMSGQWEQMLSWLRSQYEEEDLVRLPDLAHWYLRALGETGDLNGLVLAYEKLITTGLPIHPLVADLCRLSLFAFSGDRIALEKLLDGSLRTLPQSTRRFWLATADLAAGNEAGRSELQSLLETAVPVERISIERRLRLTLPHAPTTLTPKTHEILQRADTTLDHEARAGLQMRPAAAPVVTYALIAANVLAFGVETFFGGSTNMAALDKLGTLIPGAVLAGQWWRLLTSLFLHYGMLHLGMNMLGLYYLGPFVEHSLRGFKYAVVYFVSGVGSMMVIVLLTRSGVIGNGSTLGASGCIMGLVGATGAILFRLWRQEHSTAALQRLRRVVLIILMQVAFDVMTPEVSFTGHFSGTLIGFAAALLF